MRSLFRFHTFGRTTRRPAGQCRLRPAIEALEDRLVPATLPDGFTETVITNGISNPTAMEIAPDGRIFVAEQGGALRVIEQGSLLPQAFFDLNVNSSGERGLLGVAFDPNFATNQFIYVYYTTAASPVHNRVSRFTANGNVVAPNSELVLLDLNNLSSATNHNGGAIHFGLDGKLYVGVGDNANGANSQTLNNRFGKMLRINTDPAHLIPNDNPFVNQASGLNDAIWAVGLRNPFTFAVQPGTGRIFINDVGQNTWEEINDGIAGSNYGWPNSEGFRDDSDPPTSIGRYREPLVAYDHNIGPTGGCAIAGGAFYDPAVNQFPADYTGDYFFADLCSAWIRKYDPQRDQVSDFASDLPDAPVDLKVDAAGNLYYLTRGSGSNTGQVTRVQFPAAQNAPTITQHPTNQQVAACQPATFSVMATGAAPLGYQWQRDDEDIPGSTESALTLKNLTPGDSGAMFRAVVTNSFGTATSDEATLTFRDGQAPTATITSPPDGTKYNAGDTINFSGGGTDPDDGSLPPGSLTWEVNFHHEDHTHPFIQPYSGVSSDSFVIPTVGETSADVFYRIHLTASDSDGCTHSTFRDVTPNTSMITLTTNPPGLQVLLDSQPTTDGTWFSGVVGMQRMIGVVEPQFFGIASPLAFSAQWLNFRSWSDGGASAHQIITPASDATFTAEFQSVPYTEVDDLQLDMDGQRLTQLRVHFNRALDPATAMDPRNFRIVAPGRDKRFNTAGARSTDDVMIPFDTPLYSEPSGQGGIDGQVLLSLRRAVPLGTFIQITVDGTKLDATDHAITSASGFVLDGEYHDVGLSGDGIESGDFVALIGVGKRLSYRDRGGDQVTFSLTGGFLQLTREAPASNGKSAEGISLIGRTTGSNGELSGRVRRKGGDGRTTLASLWITGPAIIRIKPENDPAFAIRHIMAARLVDRVLESPGHVRHRFDDLLDVLPRRQ